MDFGNIRLFHNTIQNVDLTIPQIIAVIPAMPWRFRPFLNVSFSPKTRTATTGPAVSCGTNCMTFDNVYPSQVWSQAISAPLHGFAVLSAVIPLVAQDMSQTGLILNITTGATGGTLIGDVDVIAELIML